MQKKRRARPVGTDLEWFVIPIEQIRRWGIILLVLLAAGVSGYFLYTRSRRSPEQKAKVEIAEAETLLRRATEAAGAARPGSTVAQASDLLEDARGSFQRQQFDEAFRLAVESQSYSRRALGVAGGEDRGDASFIFVEGDVSVQHAGRSDFEPAKQRQPLFKGDFIKTGRSGSAEIMFHDGTLYTIRPGSLFEVHRPESSQVRGSQVKMVSGTINVYTAASTSTVAAGPATASIGRDSQVAVDVEAGERTEVTTFRGTTTVTTGQESVVLRDRERVSAGARTGTLSAKIVLPETPQLFLPLDSRVYDLKTGEQVDLKWSKVPGAARYRLQISHSRLFVPDATEVDLDDRRENRAQVKVSREGSYFWRVAAINSDGVSSDWSSVRRFRMLTEPLRAGTGDTAPPVLTLSPLQQMGNLFLIFGKTEPGAIVTVNAEPADVESDGSFKKTITIDREGYSTLVIKSVDASGNETVRQLPVFVEFM